MTASPERRSTDLFAHQLGDGTFTDFHNSSLGVRMFGSGEVHPVRVVEDPEGPLWGWWCNATGRHSMIFGSFLSLNTCFEYGVAKAQAAEHGEAVRLRAESR